MKARTYSLIGILGIMSLYDAFLPLSLASGLGILSALIATLWLFGAARGRTGADKRSFYWLGAGNISHAASVWTGVELFATLQIALYVVALCVMIYHKRRFFEKARDVLDALIVMTAASALAWPHLIEPLWNGAIGDPSGPVNDLVLLCAGLCLYYGAPGAMPRRAMTLLFLGVLAQVLVDSAALYLALHRPDLPGGLLEPFRALAPVLIGLSGLYADKRDAASAFSRLRLLLPLLSVCGLLAATIWNRQLFGALAVGLACSVGLLIVRQLLVLRENHRLCAALEQRDDIEAAYQEMQHMAYHDVLTKLPNRRLFEGRVREAMKEAQASGKRVAVMFVDLDRFKSINDCLGHDIGDLLLQNVSHRLLACLREGDTVSRQGGDEFTLLLTAIDEVAEVERVARRIHAALNRSFLLDGHDLHVTMSLGIALYPQDGMTVESLMKHADIAMYAAKEQGKNNYQFFTSAMKAELTNKMLMENALRRALERHEFVLQYQPQVQIETGAIIGMEALIRWQHPDFGTVPPGIFIPLAEETGLIVEIGEWALREACQQNKRWQEMGYPPLKIGVNLSPRQFMHEKLVDTVADVLRTTGLHPQYLDLEITESIAMQDADFVIEKLQQLRGLGIQISIDDFGTGYSSLSYIKKFPINTLKIAQPFVSELTESPDDAAIVSAIIAMAHGLNMNVIAEGVETDYQRAFLRKLRCDEMQGFLYSKPLSADTFTKLLKNRAKTAGYPLSHELSL